MQLLEVSNWLFERKKARHLQRSQHANDASDVMSCWDLYHILTVLSRWSLPTMAGNTSSKDAMWWQLWPNLFFKKIKLSLLATQDTNIFLITTILKFWKSYMFITPSVYSSLENELSSWDVEKSSLGSYWEFRQTYWMYNSSEASAKMI